MRRLDALEFGLLFCVLLVSLLGAALLAAVLGLDPKDVR